jgi:CRP-like cAMP-binding protein
MTERERFGIASLRNVALFRDADESILAHAWTLLHEQRSSKGDIIFQQGDPGGCLYLIAEGRVRIFLASPDGREATVRIYGPNSAFGELSVLDGAPRSANAAALDDLVMFVLYRDDVQELLRRNFVLVQQTIGMLAERLRYTTHYSEQLAFLRAPGRVAARLAQLAYAVELGEPARLEITQEELAAFATTTREWVNRALRDFADRGLIKLSRGSVIVLDPRGLLEQIK